MANIDKVIKAIETHISADDSIGCDDCTYENDGWCMARVMKDALELLKEQQPIVRCKDCKWWDKKPDSPYGYCHACKHGHHSEHWEIGIYRTYKGDWFCADGERQ